MSEMLSAVYGAPWDDSGAQHGDVAPQSQPNPAQAPDDLYDRVLTLLDQTTIGGVYEPIP